MATVVSAEKVKDPDLAVWLSEDSEESREILVEAVLPGRKIIYEQVGGRLRPADLRSAPASQGRKETLSRLRAILERLLDTPPVVLESAGALAVRASSRQVRQFMDHPLVKSVRPNRRLRRPA